MHVQTIYIYIVRDVHDTTLCDRKRLSVTCGRSVVSNPNTLKLDDLFNSSSIVTLEFLFIKTINMSQSSSMSTYK
jgi:hypothetical protein